MRGRDGGGEMEGGRGEVGSERKKGVETREEGEGKG